MKVRSTLFRVLLALLLVFSQQMGYAHALTHTKAGEAHGGAAAVQQLAAQLADHDADDSLSGITKLGFDHSCAQCLAVAQMTAAVDSHFPSFPLLDGVAVVNVSATPVAPVTATIRAYRSRAPPVLS